MFIKEVSGFGVILGEPVNEPAAHEGRVGLSRMNATRYKDYLFIVIVLAVSSECQ